ncbi:DNA primase [Chloroflexota bacterium]
MSVIDEVKQKTDIIEIIGQYATLTKAGRNFKALCPFHSEKHASFFVYPEQQSWHCFGACGTGGDAFSFVMKKEGIEFGDALRLLAERAGVTIPTTSTKAPGKEEREELYQINDAASLYFHNLLLNATAGEKARNYVTSRGFSPKTISDFQLGFSLDRWESLKQYLLERNYTEDKLLEAGLIIQADNGKTHDRFRSRLIFPIRDNRGRTIGFGARALDDSQPKYLNSPQTPLFDKSSILYGIDLAASAIRQHDMAIIVEGYIDVITAHQNGINNVVASMGTAVTETQVAMLKKLSKNLVLALDADIAGEEAMLRGVSYENILNAEVRVITLPEGKDPDDVIKEDASVWQQLVAEAQPIVDYTFDMVTAKLDLSTARDKPQAVERLLPIIAAIKETVRQSHYLQKLARLTDVPLHIIENALNKSKSSPVRSRRSEPRQSALPSARLSLVSDRCEEDSLSLLLQNPELKASGTDLLPEYFEHSENREIFTAWRQSDDIEALKEKLDITLHEYLDSLVSKSLFSTQLEQRYAEYVRQLRKKFLKSLEAKRAEHFAIEAASGGTVAELAKLEQEGIAPSIGLREIYSPQKSVESRAKEVRNEHR